MNSGFLLHSSVISFNDIPMVNSKLKENSKNIIKQKIEEFDREIQRKQNELENGERGERTLSTIISESSKTMSNATYSMAYHKKFLQ